MKNIFNKKYYLSIFLCIVGSFVSGATTPKLVLQVINNLSMGRQIYCDIPPILLAGTTQSFTPFYVGPNDRRSVIIIPATQPIDGNYIKGSFSCLVDGEPLPFLQWYNFSVPAGGAAVGSNLTFFIYQTQVKYTDLEPLGNNILQGTMRYLNLPNIRIIENYLLD